MIKIKTYKTTGDFLPVKEFSFPSSRSSRYFSMKNSKGSRPVSKNFKRIVSVREFKPEFLNPKLALAQHPTMHMKSQKSLLISSPSIPIKLNHNSENFSRPGSVLFYPDPREKLRNFTDKFFRDQSVNNHPLKIYKPSRKITVRLDEKSNESKVGVHDNVSPYKNLSCLDFKEESFEKMIKKKVVKVQAWVPQPTIYTNSFIE
ncbi:hypothetical protein SteCoe_10263 [Stentor coeruleus]|uniref:Uncharacterized protein n=1 Tax=Stentor coeruleus TaxID=5963 RepID=A0A1R2CG06_9CILI|nr:hypothetical protein SteCoe_10263 [Stentor coeruleus]